MKKFIPILLFGVLFVQTIAYSQSPVVQSILEEMNIDSIVFFARELSGDVETNINGTPYTILSRHKNQPGNDKAADYIQQKLEYYGLEVFNQSFGSIGRNVYGVQTGTDYPNQKYIICAHYDDMPSGTLAPGADDNGSGTAAVLETARVLSQQSFPFTIIYALWDEEEIGLFGSGYYAANAASQGDSILGVINQDMIAWDENDDGNADVHTKSVGESHALKDKMLEVNLTYGIGLDLDVIDPGEPYSDHQSFWNNGFTAILLIEDDNDFNNYYHTTNDLFIHYNQPYYEKMAKLSAATLATIALNLDMRISHTPIASRDNTEDIQTSAEIITGLTIGSGNAAPRLYFRYGYNQGGPWTDFYEVIGFDGPGQGATLIDGGIAMDIRWEKPTSVILDYFDLDDITLIGLSVGGWLCLRAAAFESRIKRVVATGHAIHYMEIPPAPIAWIMNFFVKFEGIFI